MAVPVTRLLFGLISMLSFVGWAELAKPNNPPLESDASNYAINSDPALRTTGL